MSENEEKRPETVGTESVGVKEAEITAQPKAGGKESDIPEDLTQMLAYAQLKNDNTVLSDGTNISEVKNEAEENDVVVMDVLKNKRNAQTADSASAENPGEEAQTARNRKLRTKSTPDVKSLLPVPERR